MYFSPTASGLVLLAAAVAAGSSGNPALQEVFRWKQLDFQLPDNISRQELLSSGRFIPRNNAPVGLDVWREKLFVTVPRWRSGVVSTLNYIRLDDVRDSPVLRPYPDWASNDLSEEEGTKVVSVLRVRVDECDRLWVMDMGQDDVQGNIRQITPPKILVYDLLTDELLLQYIFNKDLAKENSFFSNIFVDVSPHSCSRAFAYVPDFGSYAVIVFNLEARRAHRVQHNYFHMDPLAGNYHVAGLNFQWTDGVFSLALAPVLEEGSRTVYFHALSSNMEFQVNSRTLQNENASRNFDAFKVLGYKGPDSQSVSSFLDPQTGVLFYSLASKSGVGCWNSFLHASDFSPRTNDVLVSDERTMTFISDLKVDRESNLWLLSDKLPVFLYGEINPKEVNYRVFKGKTEEVIKGTGCDAVRAADRNEPKKSQGWFFNFDRIFNL